jgi:hypothetical protein
MVLRLANLFAIPPESYPPSTYRVIRQVNRHDVYIPIKIRTTIPYPRSNVMHALVIEWSVRQRIQVFNL